MHFSIIIPVYNEENSIHELLRQLEPFSQNHEIIFINDGSTDHTLEYLSQSSFIQIYSNLSQEGKGASIRLGLEKAQNDYIILMDGDLEVSPQNIHALMAPIIQSKAQAVFGSRWLGINRGIGLFDIGNWFLNSLFNLLNGVSYLDVLCCFKVFNRTHLPIHQLRSKTFDIEVEISAMMIQSIELIAEIPITYERRNINEGKKLRFRDGFTILKRIFSSKFRQ